MALQTRIGDFITAIGTDYKQLRTWITGSSTGDLTGLTTTAKTSLVAAINETKAGNSGTPPDATEVTKGIAQIATQAETAAGTSDAKTVSPLKLAQKLAAWAQPLSANLTSLAAVASGAFGRTLLGSVDASSAKASLGLATVATSGSAADLTGVLGTAQLPPLAIQETFTAATQADMLALTAQRGDVAIRTDLGSKMYILTSDAPSVLANWVALTAAGDVTSVAGKVGGVTLVKGDVGLANVDNTADASKPVSTAQAAADTAIGTAASSDATTKANNAQAFAIQRANHTGTQAESTVTNLVTDLAAKAPLASPAFTGTPTGITKAHVGLANVDNTADASKPVSTAQAAAIATKLDKSANLSDLASVATARTNLAVYSQAELGNPETDLAALYLAAKA